MNYRMILNIIGKTMLASALFILLPCFVQLYYGEQNLIAFWLPSLLLCVIGAPCLFIKVKEKAIYAKEGFVIVALCWIILSLVGALPFVISGTITNYADAVFETVSGFTTTGATILTSAKIDYLYKTARGILFWRSFTHFIGGMGVLVFVLALFPKYGEGVMHVFRAESPGPSASKFVSKMKRTAMILYAIYTAMTLILMVMLYFGGIGLYDSVLTAFATAGTGGFAPHGTSIAFYDSVYVEMVVATFMLLFGVNFNLYYLILIGNVTKIFKSEEFRAYLLIIFFATLLITLNIFRLATSFGEALRISYFQVTSIISTTGFATFDFGTFPAFSKTIILLLMIMGACGGSTGGGVKVSRFLILYKSGSSDMKKMINSRAVITKKFEGETLSSETERNVRTFIIFWLVIVFVSTLILSLDSFAGKDMFTHLSASITCIGNVGPGFNMVGPSFDFSGYNEISKCVLSIVMLAGRLEIFPLLILLRPRTWRRGN